MTDAAVANHPQLTKPIDWAKAAVDTMMRTYAAADLPPKGVFHYHQGVFLSGVWQTALLTGDERYFKYVKDWMDSVISPDGDIIEYRHGDFDDMQPGILLYGLIDHYGDAKYKKALDNDLEQLKAVPVGPTGGYWHKMFRNSQMWLDGLYMAGPLMSEYAARYNRPDLANQVAFQAQLMYDMTLNPKTGLLLHAWDARKVQPWADPETGKSPEHWGRSIGWVPVALIDDADFLPEGSHEKAVVLDLAHKVLTAVLKYQSDEGRWYQVVDKGNEPGNWLENSCSALFVSALAKAVYKGYVTGDEAAQWAAAAQRGYQAVINSLEWKGNDLQVGNVCIGTGVGDYQFYIDRPVHTNDLHGVGGFLLMCAEMQRLDDYLAANKESKAMAEFTKGDQNPTAPRPASAKTVAADPAIMPVFRDVPADRPKRRYAVVGTGHRSGMYVDAITGTHSDVAELVAWCDTNPTRMAYYDGVAGEALGLGGPAGLPQYGPDDLEKMIADEKVDVVIITTPDYTHAELVARSQAAGADVVVEKPLTTTASGIQTIEKSVADTGRDVIMTFNYRYSPRNSTLREVIQSGVIGDVTSIHFEWVLDTVHGADYFRRWHREADKSGTLLIHKAAHHFDLVNYWLNDKPERVYASAGLKFYGQENAASRGVNERPVRGTGLEGTAFEKDPWAFDLRKDNRLNELYYKAEHHDGYLRDKDVFNEEAGKISIFDNMAVLVDYAKGATLTYSLNAHAPWEGYTVYVNGTKGRAELTVIERGAVIIDADGNVVLDPSANPEGVKGHLVESSTHWTPEQLAQIEKDRANPIRPEGERLVVQNHWQTAREWPIPAGSGGHGGGDAILLAEIFRGDLRVGDDPLGRAAGYLDGVRAVAVGIAANESIKTGQAVNIADLGIDQG